MSGTTTIDSSMPFDLYTTSFDAAQLQTYSEFPPVSIFDTEDFGADLTSDSASPLSPLSPALSASSFGFPSTDAWTAWDSAELSPEPENLFGCQTLSSCPPSNSSLSPVMNPLDLATAAPLDSQAPLFQSPQAMVAPIPNQQQSPAAMTTALSTPPTPSTDAAAKRYPSRSLKRKSASEPSADKPSPKSTTVSPPATSATTTRRSSASKQTKDSPTALGPKKTAHNMIEKRYRTNLNDKITQLRDSVPSLRLMAQRAKMAETGTSDFEDGAEEGGLLDASTAALPIGGGGGGGVAKLNKATILSKATEYILQLERRNHGLETENSALRGRMEGLEMMLMRATAGVSAGVGVGGSGPIAGIWN